MPVMPVERDHGGDLDAAIAAYGGASEAWIDLSTGINRVCYPVGLLSPGAWRQLPTKSDMARVVASARSAYGTAAPILAVAGAQAAIQLIPMLRPKGNAAVLGPTYNEHAAALRAHGWNVCEVDHLEDLAGADIAIVVNPNNPDGRVYSRPRLLDLVGRVGCLVVDESFVDPTPEVSVAAEAGRPGLIVLRSFGKFYGLAGFRLGFVIGHDADVARLGELAGPWSVSGPALEIGSIALADAAWAAAARQRLAAGVPRLDAMAARAGWTLVGGTALFRLYDCADAPTAQHRLAQHRIWSRIFPWSQHFVRLGLPGGDDEWSRVAAAFDDLAE